MPTQILFYGLFTTLVSITILILLSMLYISIIKHQVSIFTDQLKSIERTMINFTSKHYGILLNDFAE